MATSTTAPNSNVNGNGTPSSTSLPSESRCGGSDPIAWLQARIGSYDAAHDLEPLVQKSVLKGLKHVPKRSGRIKTELIDLDLVRGSPFPKPNTQFCWDAFSKKSLLRFLLPQAPMIMQVIFICSIEHVFHTAEAIIENSVFSSVPFFMDFVYTHIQHIVRYASPRQPVFFFNVP